MLATQGQQKALTFQLPHFAVEPTCNLERYSPNARRQHPMFFRRTTAFANMALPGNLFLVHGHNVLINFQVLQPNAAIAQATAQRGQGWMPMQGRHKVS